MFTSNNASNIIESINESLKLSPAPELNFTYIQSGMPNTFTILKRATADPYMSFPLVTLMFASDLKYAGSVEIVKEVCELYSRLEFQYNQENQKEEKKSIK